MICGLLTGASYPLRALGVFQKSPHLLRFLLVPIGLNCVIGIGLYLGLLFPAWDALTDLMATLTHQLDTLIANLPAWLSLLDYAILGLGWLLRLLLVLGLFLVSGFIFLQFGVILGAPWYGQLSEQMEKLRTGKVEIVQIHIIQDIWRAILFEFKKIALWLAIALPLLLVNFIPGLGSIVASIGGISLTAAIAGLDFLDGPSERRRFSFRQKLSFIWKTLPASASFSLVCLILSSIPLVNLVTIPICVASGTLFWCDRVLPQLPPSPVSRTLDEPSTS
jgi:CysZ protein